MTEVNFPLTPVLLCSQLPSGCAYLSVFWAKRDDPVSRQPDATPEIRTGEVVGEPGVTVSGFGAYTSLCFGVKLGQREKQKQALIDIILLDRTPTRRTSTIPSNSKVL